MSSGSPTRALARSCSGCTACLGPIETFAGVIEVSYGISSRHSTHRVEAAFVLLTVAFEEEAQVEHQARAAGDEQATEASVAVRYGGIASNPTWSRPARTTAGSVSSVWGARRPRTSGSAFGGKSTWSALGCPTRVTLVGVESSTLVAYNATGRYDRRRIVLLTLQRYSVRMWHSCCQILSRRL